MNKIVYDLLLKLEQCDDRHNRCDYLMEHDEITYLLEHIQEKDKEIERLNNIIEELEKWIEEYRNGTGLDSYETGIYDALGDVQNKLKELRNEDAK